MKIRRDTTNMVSAHPADRIATTVVTRVSPSREWSTMLSDISVFVVVVVVVSAGTYRRLIQSYGAATGFPAGRAFRFSCLGVLGFGREVVGSRAEGRYRAGRTSIL